MQQHWADTRSIERIFCFRKELIRIDLANELNVIESNRESNNTAVRTFT